MIKKLFCIFVAIFLISALLYAGFSIGIVEGIFGVLGITIFLVYIYKEIINNESNIYQNIYQKAVYEKTIDIYGNYENKYLYCHYNSCTDTYCIKDETGSTLINMCFEDTYYNKMNAMWKLYNHEGEDITQKEYENIRTIYEDY